MQKYANITACEWADESSPDADIHMRLTPITYLQFSHVARVTHSLATFNERLILDFKRAVAALVH